jgi:hypothetical protein
MIGSRQVDANTGKILRERRQCSVQAHSSGIPHRSNHAAHIVEHLLRESPRSTKILLQPHPLCSSSRRSPNEGRAPSSCVRARRGVREQCATAPGFTTLGEKLPGGLKPRLTSRTLGLRACLVLAQNDEQACESIDTEIEHTIRSVPKGERRATKTHQKMNDALTRNPEQSQTGSKSHRNLASHEKEQRWRDSNVGARQSSLMRMPYMKWRVAFLSRFSSSNSSL